MLMFCVVVLYFLATGKTYPFIEKDIMPYDKRNFVQTELQNKELTDRMFPGVPGTNSNGNGDMDRVGKEILDNLIGNIVTTSDKSGVNEHNTTLTKLTQTATYNTNNAKRNITSDKLNSKLVTDLNYHSKEKVKKDHINSYLIHLPYYLQKYVQKENPLKGFLRETILVPGHRKQRRRRSFYLDFDMFTDFPEEEPDVVFSAHTSPCDWSDRYYCLNGGTCVFVHALEIKTCR